MWYILLCLTVLLLKFHIGAYGYMIDPDCGSDTQYVKDRIDTAFRLMAHTVTELNKNPVSPDIENLHNTLFGSPWDPSKTKNVKAQFEFFAGISQHNDVDQTAPHPEKDVRIFDVRFYCTVKRIQKRRNGDKTEYVNTDRNIAYEEKDLTFPGGRYANCFDIKSPTMMVTLNIRNQYSEIQICPWFLRKSRGFKTRDLADIPSAAFAGLGKIAIPYVANKYYTPIDSFVLVDKMIVHELTHTDQNYWPTVDMAPKPYGWRNARNLVQQFAENDQEARFDPLLNADSNALFAVGAWLLSQPGAVPIGADGRFPKPQATPKAKV